MTVQQTSRGRFLHVYRTSYFRARVSRIEESPNAGMVHVVLEVPAEEIERVREMKNDWAEVTPTFAKLRDKKMG